MCRAGNAGQRQAIVERPLLYLALDEKQDASAAPTDAGAEREQRCAVHLDTLRALYADCQGNRGRVWEEARKQSLTISYQALTAFLHHPGVGVKVKQPAGQDHFAPGEEMQHDSSPHDVKVGQTVRRLQCARLVLC